MKISRPIWGGPHDPNAAKEEGSSQQRRTLTGTQLMSNRELRMSKRGTSLLVGYMARQ